MIGSYHSVRFFGFLLGWVIIILKFEPMVAYKMQQGSSQIKSSDLLSLQQQRAFGPLLNQHQRIILSTKIMKFNRDGKCQERILVLTNQAILNILKNNNIIKAFMKKFVNFEDKYEVRRRIPLPQLYGITITPDRKSNAFLLHVVNDHDYYYKADNNKMLLLQSISQQYLKTTKKQLPFYFKQELVLLNYCTFKNHLRQKKDLKPKENPHYLNQDYFRQQQFQDTEYFSEMLQQSQQKQSIKPKHFCRVDMAQLNPQSTYYVLKEEENRSIHLFYLQKNPGLLNPSFCFFNERKQLLFTPFLLGGCLRNYICKYLPLTKENLLFYLWQMILILENLQPKFYLNLSLENIYVRANGYLMLDGLQKIKEGKVKEDEKVYYKLEGNAYYFAPEMITFQGYSSESVVWKLGICAYYLFKGRYPFEGKNLKELYYNILTKDLEEDPDVPEYIVKMLIKDKKKRITLEQLKKHPDLEPYNWKALAFEKIKAPFPVHINNWTGKVPIVYELKAPAQQIPRKGSLN